jgi:hypothetical protein
LFFRVGWIASGRCPHLFCRFCFPRRSAGQRSLGMRRAASLASLCPRTELPWAVLMQVWSVCNGANTKSGALSFYYFIYSSTDRAGIRGAGQPALFIAHTAQKQVKRSAPRYKKKYRPRVYVRVGFEALRLYTYAPISISTSTRPLLPSSRLLSSPRSHCSASLASVPSASSTLTAASFRRLLCLHYAALQPLPWWYHFACWQREQHG